jgi:DMSO/TMAO reductase YedYZ molybdopterin-dependent catalytic subunit
VRAVVPGIYGIKNAKYIIEIEVVDYEYVGYWIVVYPRINRAPE